MKLGILNNNEIQEVFNRLSKSLIGRYSNVRAFSIAGLNQLEVIAISSKGLIMIKGNSVTGYMHIKERHGHWSTNTYPLKSGFQNPSKFPSNIYPAKYIDLANEIYDPSNLLINNEHLDSDKFEKYVGSYKSNKEELVNLILYKGTKIIHSMYPQSKEHNKIIIRKKYPFVRGLVEIDDKGDVHIPYFDNRYQLKYVVLIEKNVKEGKESWKLLVYDEDRNYKHHYNIAEQELTIFYGEKSKKIAYQYTDLRKIEDFIRDIDNRINRDLQK